MKAKYLATIALVVVLTGATAKFGLATQAIAQITKTPPTSQAATRFGAAIEDELAVRSRQLDNREQELKNREALLQATETRIQAHIQSLKDQEAAVKAIIQAKTNMEDQQLLKLSLVYGAMKPKAAANLMNKLDEKLQYDIARRMKDYVLSPILTHMDPDKAAKLTSMLSEKVATPALISPDAKLGAQNGAAFLERSPMAIAG